MSAWSRLSLYSGRYNALPRHSLPPGGEGLGWEVASRGGNAKGCVKELALPPSDENAEPRAKRSGVSGLRCAAYFATLRARLRKSCRLLHYVSCAAQEKRRLLR